MRENNLDILPVYEGNRFIADISKDEITDFLNHLDNGKNIYFHKLNFDLGTTLMKIREQSSRPKKLSDVLIRVAVLAFAILGLVWMFFNSPQDKHHGSLQNNVNLPLAENDILPGSNKATLTLANGKTINLSEAKTGVVVVNASSLKYNDNTAVISNNSPSSQTSPRHLDDRRDLLNSTEKITVATPRGGQYQITLPDGTRVWLNAASSLKFPSSFAGKAQRKIELSGEAYFEVAKNKKQPFIVISNEQLVEVLGTHFSISNYADEGSIKTTLLEGSVAVRHAEFISASRTSKSAKLVRDLDLRQDDRKVQDDVILKPGQQSTFTHNKPIEVKQVDASDAIAWKDGKFAFRNESLESIMRKMARWYDIEIVYQNNQIGKEILGGSFTRSEQISTILTTLELASDAHFKIQGKKIIITK
jgi:ferric-dicitrate binding protein FerR (iron transport regulator)